MSSKVAGGLFLLAAGVAVYLGKRGGMVRAFPVDISSGVEVVSSSDFSGLPNTRGFRNNNPGNIEYNPANDWLGQTGSDGRYCIFSDMKFGVRAIGKLLDTYYQRHALVTIRQMVERWAPDTENNTAAYINSVSQYMVHDPDYLLRWPEQKPIMVEAIIRHENGSQPFSHAFIEGALSL